MCYIGVVDRTYREVNGRMRWIYTPECSCGKEMIGYYKTSLKQNPKFEAEKALDRHMMKVHGKSSMVDTRREDMSEPQMPSEQVEIAAEMIAVHGAPPLIARGDSVIGVSGGMWIGKRGQVIDLGNFDDEPQAKKGQDRIRVLFYDEIDVPAHAFVPLGNEDTRTHEDDQDAIERPPTRDASHDVRHAVPSSQGNDEHDQRQHLIAIIDAPINPGMGTMRYVSNRWDLFSNEELCLIAATALHEGTRIKPGHKLAVELSTAIDRRRIIVERDDL